MCFKLVLAKMLVEQTKFLQLEFMIKNNENMPFEIEGNLLKIKSPLDFEKQNKYKVYFFI